MMSLVINTRLLLLQIMLLGFVLHVKAQDLKLEGPIREIEIFYCDPNMPAPFSGLKAGEVIYRSREDYRDSVKTNRETFFLKIRDQQTITAIADLLSSLHLCRKDDHVGQGLVDARVVLKIKYTRSKHEDYIVLGSVYNQWITFQDRIFNRDKKFYSYILSLWPVEHSYERPLLDGSCDDYEALER